MALVRTLSKGLRKTPRQGGNPGDVDGPTVTISGYPADPTDDPTPTFTFSANESGCTFEYKINAGSYAACTSPLTLGAQTDGTYTIYIRATDKQGNVGAAATYSWDLATAYAGSYPTTVAALNGWTLASPWTVMHNYNDATIGPSACAAATGSATLTMQKLGASNTATLESAGQGGYAAQEGYTVNASDDSLYYFATATWKFSATVPTAYLVTFKFTGTPTSGTYFFGGVDGANGGWYLEAHATSGIRAGIGSGSAYVNTSYVGGTSFYDNDYHTILLVIDDAAGKAKIYSEFANTESTGLTISSGNALITVGPLSAGGTWGVPCTYLLTARGEHDLLYTNAQSLFDQYELARTTNVNQTAIAGLPTTLSELNSVTGLSFTTAYNLSSATSNAPITGASGPTITPNTGTLRGGGTGTAPTLATAPQVRTSFTSQKALDFDSSKDNLQGTDLWPDYNFTAFIVFKAAYASGADIAERLSTTAGQRGFRFYYDAGGSGYVTLLSYNSYSTVVNHQITAPTGVATNFNLFSFRVPSASGERSRIKCGKNAAANSGGTYGSPGTANSITASLGANLNDAFRTATIAFAGYVSGQVADATMDAAHEAFRWRYGI